MDKIFRSMEISATALTAERQRLDLIANNLANANTTRTNEGGPYRRLYPVFAEKLNKVAAFPYHKSTGAGVQIVEIVKDDSPFKLIYNPGHPDANEEGYVAMPNVDIIREMVDMVSAMRAYEANVTVLQSSKEMVLKSLDIAR